MNELSLQIKRKIARYEAVEIYNLTLYPVRVYEYEYFLMSKVALEVLHQSLKLEYMRMPYLSALYAMDYEARMSGQPMTGLFSCALIGLALSLRLGEGLSLAERVGLFRIIPDRENPARLVGLQFEGKDGEVKTIEPSMYKDLRQIIAAQNGVKLESDEANPDIVQAKKDMAVGSGADLDFSVEALISFAAAMSGADEEEIDQWPVLKLTRRTESFQTVLAYLVCGIGEASGSTWKGGNPVPHPIFKRLNNGSGFAAPMETDKDGNAVVQSIESQLSQHNHP